MFCNYCGRSVPNDALFCNHCGKQLSGVASVPELSNTVSQSSIPVVAIQTKSLTIAGLLEFLIPGAGLIYASQVVAGLAVLLGTVVAGICVGIIYSNMVQQAIAIAADPTSSCAAFGTASYNPCIDYSAANNFRAFALLCTIAWLAGRIAWAANAASNYNRSIAGTARQL